MQSTDVRNNFDTFLASGEEVERRCRNILGGEGFDSRNRPQPNSPWDFEFEAGGDWWKVEVKRDYTAQRTGNMYFEVECRGRPSGIRKPEPDYWMHAVEEGGAVFLFRRLELVKFLDECVISGHARLVTGGGDDGQSSGIILPLRLVNHVPFVKEYW